MRAQSEIDRQIEAIIEDLATTPGVLPLAEIERVVRGEYEQMCREARFDDYVPVLVRRRLRQSMRATGYRRSPPS